MVLIQKPQHKSFTLIFPTVEPKSQSQLWNSYWRREEPYCLRVSWGKGEGERDTCSPLTWLSTTWCLCYRSKSLDRTIVVQKKQGKQNCPQSLILGRCSWKREMAESQTIRKGKDSKIPFGLTKKSYKLRFGSSSWRMSSDKWLFFMCPLLLLPGLAPSCM